MDPRFGLLTGIFGALGVAFGAFGAHALRARLAPAMLAVYHTAVLYHLVHALALGLVAVLVASKPSALGSGAGAAFVIGIVLFSGSLYALALSGVRGLGAVTPFGGVAFLVGWALLALAAWRG